MRYTIESVAQILGLRLGCVPGIENTIDNLLTDSRDLGNPQGVLFFAIRTLGNDGHRYVSELYNNGVRNFVVEYIPEGLETLPGAVFLKVPSVLKALHTLAAHHRRRFDIPVIAITGSRGKTTVKEWLYAMLHNDQNIVRSPRSYNSTIGVPLSVWGMESRHSLAIFEAAISRRGDMADLEEILHPNVGIITCLGPEHDEGFASRLEKGMEKCSLFSGCQYVIFNGDDPLVRQCVEAQCPDSQKIGWSLSDPQAPVYISSLTTVGNKTVVNYVHQGQSHSLTIPFVGQIDVANALHCLATLLVLRVPDENIATRMTTLLAVDTRLDVMEGVNNCLLFNDRFTPDVESLRIALDFMTRYNTQGRAMTAILTTAYHNPSARPEIHRRVARTLQDKGVTRFIAVGREWRQNAALFPSTTLYFDDVEHMLMSMSPADFGSELILIKDSVRHSLNPVREMLESRHHETTLQVNLDALTANFNAFRAMLPSDTGIVAMVKADAYGTGSLEVAKAMQTQGAAYLAVAVVDEGVALRKAGITMPIMVLNPRVTNYRALFTYRLEPEIYSFEILEQVAREAQKYGVNSYPIHVKLDTGMHRLGFQPDELDDLIYFLQHTPQLKVSSVFSHLATADCLDEDEYTQHQLDVFDQGVDTLRKALPDVDFKTHILNTAGIMRFGSKRHDTLARPGIGLYGVSPLPPEATPTTLRPVATLTAVITNLRDYEPGDTIGYGRRGHITKPSTIATLTIGYADGLCRQLGNGVATFMVNGHACPTVGSVCMDACMIDVTGVPCHVNDTVEIFGDVNPIQGLADTLGTIPYEILTGVSPRVKRIYYRQ